MNLPIKVNEREKRFLVIGGIVVIMIVAFNLFSWYAETRDSIKEITDAKYFMLSKQLERISEKKEIQERSKSVRRELEGEEKKLLSGNTPPVAAAALQRFLKERASSLRIDIKVERTLSPVETEYYLGIPVEIGFTASTKELKDLLLKLRKSSYLLTVSEIKVRVTNVNKPVDVYTTLVVTGFIKKPMAVEEKGA